MSCRTHHTGLQVRGRQSWRRMACALGGGRTRYLPSSQPLLRRGPQQKNACRVLAVHFLVLAGSEGSARGGEEPFFCGNRSCHQKRSLDLRAARHVAGGGGGVVTVAVDCWRWTT